MIKLKPFDDLKLDDLVEDSYCRDYTYLIETFGLDVLIEKDSNDYSGDSLILFRHKETGKYGYLCYGWGSCSGCDAFKACETFKDFSNLREALFNKIIWFDTKELLIKYLCDKDYEGEFVDNRLYISFKDSVITYFGGKK